MLKAYQNKDIKIIRVYGDDANEYLNNIVTNNTDHVNTSNSIYSCLLTPQGKFLADFFISEFDNGFCLLVNSKFYEDLMKGLNFYKLRSKVSIKDITNSYKYLFVPFDNINAFFNSTNVSLGHTTQDDTAYAFNDPRIDKLGIHIVSDKNSFGKNELDIVEGDCLDFFLENGILGMHLIEDLTKFYPLENNLHFLNAVDFKKGCYVGQELTARMKLRNKIPRTIIPFVLDVKSNANLDNVKIKEKDNVVGEIIFQRDKFLFGHITLRKLSDKISSDMKFFLDEQQLKINQQNWLIFK